MAAAVRGALRRTSLAVSALALAALMPLAPNAKTIDTAPMQIETATLDNGLRIVVVPDHRAPVVVHSVWYQVGSVDEVKGDSGLSHMLEHLMFKGTKKHPYGELEKLVQRNGGVQNAFTSRDMTAYHQNVAKDKLPLMMELEADRMEGLVLTDGIFQPERSVVAEERKLRTDSNPVNRFFEKLQRAHFPAHTYGRPVIGWAKDIQDYSFEKALAWYRQHYAPNNAVLLIAGDVTLAEVKPLAEKTYGKVPARQVAKRAVAASPATTKPVELVVIDDTVKVPLFYRMYRAPSAFQGIAGGKGTDDAVALWALAEIFGGSDTARLYESLVMEQKLADGASADYDPVSVAEASFDIYISPRSGVPADKVIGALEKELKLLLDKGVTEAELTRAKTNLLAEEIYGRDDADTIMYRLGSWLMAGGTVANFDAWQGQLQRLTVAEVNRVARQYLDIKQSTTGVLADSQKALGKLKPTVPAGLDAALTN